MSCSETPRSRGVAALLVLGLFLIPLTGSAVAGQQVQSSINGQVTDESGAALPGVTVTITSPALQVPSLSVITDERGEYRLTPLPIGTYQVVYALSGFQTVRREQLRLTSGFVAREDVQLNVGALEESITVSGVGPVVDVTATSVTTQFTREALESTPTGRNALLSVAALLPGVRTSLDVGGNLVVTSPTITVNGQPGDTWLVVEGVMSTSPKKSLMSGGFYDYSAMEEVVSSIVTTDGDVPMKGLKMSIVMKSGGNTFHGSSYGSYTNKNLQGTNITDALRAQGITTGDVIVRRYDVSQDLGGRFIPNKLWFYTAGRVATNQDSPLEGFMPDGSPVVLDHMSKYASGKVSYQATPGNRFVGFVHWNSKIDNKNVSKFVPWESRKSQLFHATTSKIEWQVVRGTALVASVQYGRWSNNGEDSLQTSDKIPTRDIRTQYVTGDGATGQWVDEYRHHPKGTLTWFRPGLGGTHEIKAGFEFLDFAADTFYRDLRPRGNYTLLYDNGAPFQIETNNHPAYPKDPVRVVTAYGGDSWTLSRRLTLNLAARYSRENAYAEAQCRQEGEFAAAECYPKIQLPIFQSVSPRLHAAYDLFGDAKTVIKGGFTRYYQMRNYDDAARVDLASPTLTTWLWHDLNGDRLYQPGEVNLDPNLSDFVSISGGIAMVPNPDEEQEKTDEFSLAIERELMPNFGVRASAMYTRNLDKRRQRNNLRPYSAYNIPITNADPGLDGVVRTADDPGTFVTYFDYDRSLRGRAFEQPMFILDPNAEETFKTVEVAASKRMSNRWQLAASYSATKRNIPYPLAFDPNSEINAAVRTWDWQGKVSGAYLFPYGLMTSVNYQLAKGTDWGRQVLFRGGVAIPSLVVRVEPIGARRTPDVGLLDFRVEKTLRLTTNQRVQLRLNLFNLLNSSTTLTVNQRAGVDFNRPLSIMPPRIAAVSVGYDF